MMRSLSRRFQSVTAWEHPRTGHGWSEGRPSAIVTVCGLGQVTDHSAPLFLYQEHTSASDGLGWGGLQGDDPRVAGKSIKMPG